MPAGRAAELPAGQSIPVLTASHSSVFPAVGKTAVCGFVPKGGLGGPAAGVPKLLAEV